MKRLPASTIGSGGMALLGLGMDRLWGMGVTEFVLGILLLLWFLVRVVMDAFDGVADAIEGEPLP